MAQKLLDRAQVGAAVEQVGGEGMAQGVGRDAHAARLELEPPPHVGRGQALAALRDEQRVAVPRVQG
jgi:hypothetical protein